MARIKLVEQNEATGAEKERYDELAGRNAVTNMKKGLLNDAETYDAYKSSARRTPSSTHTRSQQQTPASSAHSSSSATLRVWALIPPTSFTMRRKHSLLSSQSPS